MVSVYHFLVWTPSPGQSQNIVFLSNSGLDSLKNQKATKPAFNVGPAKRHLNGVSIMAR